MPSAIADVAEILERRLSGFQKRVVALCAAIAFVEGIEAQVAGYLAPALMQDWGVSAVQITPFLVAGPLGLLVGALLIAPLADFVGRRPILLNCIFLFGICSIVTAASSSLMMLNGFRFLTGFGIGGAFANAISLTAEYSPARRRSFMVAVMLIGFISGSIAAGLMAANLVPAYGWRSVFIAGGVLSLALLPLLFFALPESIRFLVVKDRSRDAVAALLKRVDPTTDIDRNTRLVVEERQVSGINVFALFRDGRTRTTLLLWTLYFMSLLNLYLMSSWITTHTRAMGVPIALAILIGTTFQVGGVIGTTFGWMMDRVGPTVTIIAAYLTAAVGVAGIGLAGSNLTALTIAVLVSGFGIIGGQSATNGLTAIAYPTQIRATGVGWATGIGRIGSIVGPSLAGVLVGIGFSTQNIFLLAVVPALCAALAGAALGATRPTVAEGAGVKA